MTRYEEAVSAFEPITVAQARERIASEAKFILFMGYPTCPFCQRFVPKLSVVAKEIDAKIAYINSQDWSQAEDIQVFRKRYGIATVPALFVAENGAAKVVCDSSLSLEDIEDFIS